jgi:hypothetical protein
LNQYSWNPNDRHNVEHALGLSANGSWVAVSGEAKFSGKDDEDDPEESDPPTNYDGFVYALDTKSPSPFQKPFQYYSETYNTNGEFAFANDVALGDVFGSSGYKSRMAVGGSNTDTNYSLGGSTLPGGEGFLVSYTVDQ